jgi:hypothetical protein
MKNEKQVLNAREEKIVTIAAFTAIRRHLRTRQPGFPEQGDSNHFGTGQYCGCQLPTSGSF